MNSHSKKGYTKFIGKCRVKFRSNFYGHLLFVFDILTHIECVLSSVGKVYFGCKN